MHSKRNDKSGESSTDSSCSDEIHVYMTTTCTTTTTKPIQDEPSSNQAFCINTNNSPIATATSPVACEQ